MRRRQKKQFDPAVLQQLPGERFDQQSRAAVVIGQLGMHLSQPDRFRVAADKYRRPPLQGRVVQEQARQLQAGVAADSSNRGLY